MPDTTYPCIFYLLYVWYIHQFKLCVSVSILIMNVKFKVVGIILEKIDFNYEKTKSVELYLSNVRLVAHIIVTPYIYNKILRQLLVHNCFNIFLCNKSNEP